MKLRKSIPLIVQQAARIPLTLAMSLLAIAIACQPAAIELLQFDRAAIEAGQLWRLATCHLTHWNAEHLQWDWLTFVVLGAVCEIRSPRRMRIAVVSAAACVSMLVFCWLPSVAEYRGLSGIDTALFTLLAMDLLADARRERSGMLTLAIGGLLVGFITKTAYEAVTGQAFFVDQFSAGFELLVWDHIVAAVVGVVVAFGTAAPKSTQDASRRNPVYAASY